MKKIIAILALTCLLLTGCSAEDMSSLRDISRPYAAEYKCKKLQLGGEELLDRFESIKLTLGYFGDATLSYAEKGGATGEQTGRYTAEENAFLFSVVVDGREKKYVFPYEKGVLRMTFPLGGKLLEAEFGAV